MPCDARTSRRRGSHVQNSFRPGRIAGIEVGIHCTWPCSREPGHELWLRARATARTPADRPLVDAAVSGPARAVSTSLVPLLGALLLPLPWMALNLTGFHGDPLLVSFLTG